MREVTHHIDLDEALACLPEAVRAHVLAARSGAKDAVREALLALDWPPFRAPIPEVQSLSPAQRALAEILTTMPGSPVHAFAIPRQTWNLCRWLGLAPPSALEALVDGQPRWRLATTSGVRALLDAAPLEERLLLLAEIGLGGYRLSLPPDLENDLDFFARIDGSAGDAAREAAAFCVDVFDGPDARPGGIELPEAARLAIVLGLVRAKVPLEPRWERLLPFASGTRLPLTRECLLAVPSERRAEAIAAAAARVHPGWAEPVLLSLLPEVPEKPVLAALRRTYGFGRPEAVVEEAVARLAEDHPALATLLAGKARRRPRTLRFVKKPTPPVEALDALLRAQLGSLLEAALCDGPEHFTKRIDLFEVHDARGVHRYDVALFQGEDGPVHRAGTTERVACFAQGGPSESDDTALLEALELAYFERDDPSPAKPTKPRAATKRTRRKPGS